MSVGVIGFDPATFADSNGFMQGLGSEADVATKQAEAPYAAYRFLSPMIGNQARAIGAGTNLQNSLSKFLTTPLGQSVAQSPQGQDLLNSIYSGVQGQQDLLNKGVTAGPFGSAFPGMQYNQNGQLLPPPSPVGGQNGVQPQPQYQPQPQPQTNQPGGANLPLTPSQNGRLTTLANVLNSGQAPTGNSDPSLNYQGFGAAPSQSTINNGQDAISLAQMKGITDPAIRTKVLNSMNIEKTLQYVNPDDLTSYSGGGGALDILGNKLQGAANGTALSSVLGSQSPDYQRYAAAKSAATFAANEVRQFLGDSVQGPAKQALEDFVNPGNATTDPSTAKIVFNQAKNILMNEMQTYRSALTGTNVYTNNNPLAIQSSPQQPSLSAQVAPPTPAGAQSAYPTKVINGITYENIGGSNWRRSHNS